MSRTDKPQPPSTRRANRETIPVRRFDATVGAITAKEPVDDAQTEDGDLTDYLMRAWYDLIHLSSTPVPRCPHCDGLRIRPDRPSGKSKLPVYFCHACKKSFNRLTGTPFANLKNLAKGTEMIALLSRQMSLMQAGERLGRSQKAVLSWLLAFRRYLLELDPSGKWEARVRLGVRVAPRARCTRCDFEGGFLAGGFDPQRRRRIRCPKCGRSRLLDVLQDQGEGMKGEVVHDAIDTAIRARRKVHPEMPVPVVVRTASVSDAALEVKVQDRVLWSELELPERRLPPGPVERVEDALLSKFLLEQIDKALSQSTTPVPCPWCSSEHTEYHPQQRPNGLPGFRCRACLSYFTRISNTPLNGPHMRKHALHLARMLGWRETGKAAALELGVDSAVANRWVYGLRQWLLVLDPSGRMEARVRLGIGREPIVRTCEKCGSTGPIQLLGPTNRPPGANGDRQYRFRCGNCSRHSRTWLSSIDRGVAS
ncbi:DUF746 domain-containing protein [Burkholderia sp. BE17]|uniref:DUF746 domain-containing protein n=1 Tax=Burkholderia sp. BE17 TaxID=2656644 RepID=UPI00128DA4BE|nr:DUF746 domain-containing protein [Burkholderia sp. BE17]MPV67678.1 DUF746 domain-containing protein [Burkholderia sp. BE17]